VYGKVQEAVAKDEAFAKLLAHTSYLCRIDGLQHLRRRRSI